jgi:tetratricopeptide (TPR) repeat protein
MMDKDEPLNDTKGSKPEGRSEISAFDFEVPGSAPQSKPEVKSGRRELLSRVDGPWWHSQFNLMLCVFGLLVAAAGLFILITPAPTLLLKNNTLVSADGKSTKGLASADTDQAIDNLPAPWDEKRIKQARIDSQDILSQLLTAKKELQAKSVSEWAAEAYDSALDKATKGDEFYKLKDFQNAIGRYQAALDGMQALDDLIPSILNALVAQGNAAIGDGKTELAREKFNSVITLDRNNISALVGLGRADTLDQVLSLMRQAKIDEQDFHRSDDVEFLSLATLKYQLALDLDRRTDAAKKGTQRVADLTTDKEFRDAMSNGFSALFKRQYLDAKKSFSLALKSRPNDDTASSAYRQSLASDKSSSLTSLLASGQRLEGDEEWASALSTYQTVLQRDPNQVSARLGKIRSQARKQLDTSIQMVLADTLSLARSSQREKAEAILLDAQRIKVKGRVLSRQIAEIQVSLKQLDSTIKVSFSSDSLTEVDLTKEGAKKIRLGKFSIKNLALKPGRYSVRGVRLGFKDERREIELRITSDDIQFFSIACKTPVNSASLVAN